MASPKPDVAKPTEMPKSNVNFVKPLQELISCNHVSQTLQMKWAVSSAPFETLQLCNCAMLNCVVSIYSYPIVCVSFV